MRKKDKQSIIAIFSVLALIIVCYGIRTAYINYTGSVKTEYAFLTDEDETVEIQGFVIRDENRISGKTNSSILTKSDSRVYVPIVSDSASVAKDEIIAATFSTQSAAESYQKANDLQDKINLLTSLQDQKNLSYINVQTLNSEINSSINNYISALDSGSLSDINSLIENVNYKITTKQIATGSDLDFSSALAKYKSQQAKYQNASSDVKYVRSPYAGYFVSHVDGYESAFNYSNISKKEITSDTVNKLLNSKPDTTENAYGKIIGQHTWYMVFNTSITNASEFKKGYYVNVSFPDNGIYNITMCVSDISEKNEENIAVTLKCTSMNEQLSVLRKENAEIVVNTYSGYRISNCAIYTDSETGLKGVYVLDGNIVHFKPIEILYNTADYVIAKAYTAYDSDGNIDEEETNKYIALTAYDKVIAKGRNLKDGKLIG